MIPNGAVADSGWALARLNDGGDLASRSFAYPETTQPVRLYLIDSGVANLETWFSQNSNLTVDRTEIIRGNGDPTTSGAVDHGSRMLSLIAGPETGAALGTPIHLVSLNIYPGDEGSPTTSGRMADAIARAIELHECQPSPRMPGVICLASGSSFPGEQSHILESLIEDAVAAGLTVVVSAGNEGANASDYIPAAYGTKDGVICVGASDANNRHLPNTNSGPAVDLYAPGYQVRTVSLPTPACGSYHLMSGTSPATALAAAAALIELSKNPASTPAAVEAALTTKAASAVTAPESAAASLVQVQPDPESDSDGDGSSDLIERFFGSNPADAGIRPEPMTVARISGQTRLVFAIAADLYTGSSTLRDGSKWGIRWSPDLKDWADATGTLTPGTTTDGKVPMVFSMPSPASSCFLRIEVIPAP